MKKPVCDEWLLDDWGPIPEPPVPVWERLRTAGEILLIAVVLTLGMLLFVLGVVVNLVLLATLLCLYPFGALHEVISKAPSEGTTE